MNVIAATYRLKSASADVERLSRDIALEQTVEVPESLIVCDRLRETVVGRVVSIHPVPSGVQTSDGATSKTRQKLAGEEFFDVRIDYPAALAEGGLSGLLNLIYGNISLKHGIRLTDLQLSDSVLSQYSGPRFGVEGLRRMVSVFGRPLLATALKPRGSTNEQLARLAGDFAAGGGDLVKDDHNLIDATFEDFRRRISLCQEAVTSANQRTGRSCLYFPNLAGPCHELERRAEFLVSIGVRGALIAPLLTGLDQVKQLSAQFPIALLAHPTFAGTFFHDESHGITPGLLLGTLFRLAGCDGTIFPNVGGRFSFSDNDCRDIARRSHEPLGSLKPIWPAPAGGMSFDKLPEMAEQHGTDAIFLIGGGLLGDSSDLSASTAKFLSAIERHFPTSRSSNTASSNSDAVAVQVAGVTIDQPIASACEWPGPPSKQQLLEYLRFLKDFRWDGRAPVAYKLDETLPFRSVSRTELIGSAGEQTGFDVRYFEIAPGGHSSLEKHQHTHVVIGVRGAGTLLSGDATISVTPFDVAYVPPLQVHQLRNDATEPFGFFCIVDHVRDRPQAP